jgi:SAM-dependent methyltransferase
VKDSEANNTKKMMELKINDRNAGASHAGDFSPAAKACPSCGSVDTSLFHHIRNVPVNSVMNMRSRDEALAFPRGDIALRFCRWCGFIYNSSFDPKKVRYSSDCEESQGYSPTFNAFARELAGRLVGKYGLKQKRIVEIGCGKGEFLSLLCQLGRNAGIGFDPAYVPGRVKAYNNPDVRFIKDFFNEKYVHIDADMVCCRMTLEHISETAGLLRTVRRSIGERNDTIVFFQVPDAARILRDCAFEDIYYEHCSYFSSGSLARLFQLNGFEILDISVEFGGQYILIEGKPGAMQPGVRLDREKDLDSMEKLVASFAARHSDVVLHWVRILNLEKEKNRRVVIWGSGSKGVAFLNTVKNSAHVKYAVDINPFRQGTFMAGTGQEIVSPDFLRSYPPNVIIIMNPVYLEEIRNDLVLMGLAPEIHAMGETHREVR